MDDFNSSFDAAAKSFIAQEGKAFILPRRIHEIPKNCLVSAPYFKIASRTTDFLALLDGEVRKAPAIGIPVEDACLLMKRFGSNLKPRSLGLMLRRSIPFHVLTIYKGRVRLTTREVTEKLNRKFKGRVA